jgi:hypothetical protein
MLFLFAWLIYKTKKKDDLLVLLGLVIAFTSLVVSFASIFFTVELEFVNEQNSKQNADLLKQIVQELKQK